jgi:hypothetical protein
MQAPPRDAYHSIKELISGPAAIIVLLAFFMPWVTISCEGSGIDETVSGYDLTQDQSEEGVEQEGDVQLFLIPLAALVVLGAVWMRYQGQLKEAVASRVYLAAGAIGLLIQLLKYFSLQSDLNDAEEEVGQGVIEMSYRYGWWLTALALIAIIAASFVSAQYAPPTTPPPE